MQVSYDDYCTITHVLIRVLYTLVSFYVCIIWCFFSHIYNCELFFVVFTLVYVLCLCSCICALYKTHLHLCCPGLSTCGHVAAQFWLRPALWPPLVCSRKLSGLWSCIRVRVWSRVLCRVLSRVLCRVLSRVLSSCIRVRILSRVLCRAQLSMLNLIAPLVPRRSFHSTFRIANPEGSSVGNLINPNNRWIRIQYPGRTSRNHFLPQQSEQPHMSPAVNHVDAMIKTCKHTNQETYVVEIT